MLPSFAGISRTAGLSCVFSFYQLTLRLHCIVGFAQMSALRHVATLLRKNAASNNFRGTSCIPDVVQLQIIN